MTTQTLRHEWGFDIMQWVIENWVPLLLVGGMIAMHLFGHGHGGHGDHGKHKTQKNPKPNDMAEPTSDEER